MPRRLARLALCLLVLVAARAHAAADDDPDTEAARRHFAAGSQYYDMRDYPHALVEFQDARKLRPSPALDYNVARTLDRMERWSEALVEYRKYLAARPDAPDAAETRARVKVLEARVAQAPHVPSPAAAAATATGDNRVLPAPAAPETNETHRRWVVPVIVGGAVVVAAAVVLGIVAASGGTTTVYPSASHTVMFP